ncbi:hypothetical protein BT96DRAFT_1000071 [Gymnopus androsaceus JB14]|uniref:Vacuolar protein-sorting-associated protein 36 n=1 Tax=Gymnopus androsaceus JB14 TaxID=1447944 RepID=A0A6A4H4R4_9AGAR|nr:hypothetical protein BT96DRAFT_1000071 [Gymnopus androsaceus JB14]
MSNALQDLDALMVEAKDMVKLAADLNERLNAGLHLLLPLPTRPLNVQRTRNPGHQRRWVEELAKEFGGI